MLITVFAATYTKNITRHRDCVVCGPDHPFGLRLQFTILEPGHVQGRITCDQRWNGYAALVHGGIAASIVDGAMTHALFSLGVTAVTASLEVRYHRSLCNGAELLVEARRHNVRHRVQMMESSIYQNNELCVAATAKFIEKNFEE